MEDHAATREELRQTLLRFESRVTVAAALGDAESFLASLKNLEIDVVLVDLRLPGMSGSALIQQLGHQAPTIRSLALTTLADETSVLEAVRAGAYGYLLKDEPAPRLVNAIEEAAAGAHPVSSRIAGFLLTQSRLAPPPVTLTDREAELAKALFEGLSYVECGTRMGIAIGTVQDYVKRLYRKLGVNSRSEVRDWVGRYQIR